MKIKSTTALKKITKLISENKPITIVQGGQGSSKTYSILQLLINHGHSVSNTSIYIIGDQLTKMKTTIIKDFKDIMKDIGLFNNEEWNKTESLYTFDNDSFIKFISCDKEDVGKGLRSDVCYFNEANRIDFDTYIQIASRSEKIILDYNPDTKFWAHDELMTEKNIHNVAFDILTFEDNECLKQGEVNSILDYKIRGFNEDGSIKNEYWANRWKVYGLGQLGKPQDLVFTNWVLGTYRDDLKYDLKGFGLDFGSRDPNAFVEVAIDQKSKKIYLREKFYQNELSVSQIAQLISKNVPKNSLIMADSQSTTIIHSLNEILKKEDINILPVSKNRIVDDIKLIYDYEIVIDQFSSNIINEISKYKWLDRKSETPSDVNNHALDAFRYIVQTLLLGKQEQKKKKYISI